MLRQGRQELEFEPKRWKMQGHYYVIQSRNALKKKKKTYGHPSESVSLSAHPVFAPFVGATPRQSQVYPRVSQRHCRVT